MKEIIMVRQESMVLMPGQIFSLPDNIADQILRRGSGKLLGEVLDQDRVSETVSDKPKKR